MDTLNALIDASVRGTFIGITAAFWIFGLVAVWRWFFRIMKKLILWMFPGIVKKINKDKE